MALADSKKAIGAVSTLLKDKLNTSTSGTQVDVGRPEDAKISGGPKFNLFLYQIDLDGQLRNHSLDRGQPSPIWLVLHYLLTAFDKGNESDTSDAHSMLGEGMLVLHELNFLQQASIELEDNPEPLKITFDNANTELLSKIMQGANESYRISAAFQVRPVMIAPTVAPSYSLPVKTVGPPGNEGVVVIPSLGPRLDSVEPQKFITGTEITIKGQDVNASITQVIIGGESFPVTDAAEGQVKTTVPLSTTLSAGSHSLYLVRQLPGGMELKSDCLVVQLLPQVINVSASALITTPEGVEGDLTINGNLLGGEDDTIFVAFYKDGEVALMLDVEGITAQTSLLVKVEDEQALDVGDYFIIVRVNGVQAVDAHTVNWSP